MGQKVQCDDGQGGEASFCRALARSLGLFLSVKGIIGGSGTGEWI